MMITIKINTERKHRCFTRENQRWILFIVSISSAVLFFTGCTVEKKSLPISLPETFSESGELTTSDEWWRAFDDGHLNNLIDEALQNNLDLKMAWDRLDQMTAVFGISSTSLWPQVQGEVGVQRLEVEGSVASDQTGSSSYQQGGATGFFLGTSYSVTFAASYELDLWGRVRAGRKASKSDLLASKEDLDTVAMTVTSTVALTWYELVEKRMQRELLLDQIEVNKTYLSLLESRFKKGLTSAAAVFQQKQQLLATEGELPHVESRISLLEHQLSVLRAQSPRSIEDDHNTKLPMMPVIPNTGIPAIRLMQRPDIRAAQHRLDSAEYRVVEAMAGRLPRISLTASASDQEEKFSDLFNNWFSNLLANLTMPIFDAGRLKRDVERTEAVASERLHSFAQVTLHAIREIEDSLVSERYQRDYMQNVKDQSDLAEKTLHVTVQRYQNGDSDYLPVLTALQTLQRLQRQYLEAQRVLISYRINLYRALGGGWGLSRSTDIET